MASEVDICNLALSHLGDSATVSSIDPPEGSAQAEHCATFYLVARDVLQELYDWRFCTRRARMALLSTDSWNWSYAYARPSDALRVISVLPVTADPSAPSEPYDLENKNDGTPIILTNLADATMRYTVRVVDTARFPPLFVDALAWLLAAYLAGPVLKGDAGRAEAKRCYAMFRASLVEGGNSDAAQRLVEITHTPPWVEHR